MATAMPLLLPVSILISVSAVIVVIFVICTGICGLLRKWKKRQEYYKCREMKQFKKTVMAGIVFLEFFMEDEDGENIWICTSVKHGTE